MPVPSTHGVDLRRSLLLVAANLGWFYTACQAHDCPGTALAMLYSPTEAKMVGRLTARCRVWWLGEPTAEQRAQIEQRQPLQDAALKEDSALCE